MGWDKLMRFKGLTLATFALVIAFILYLLLNSVIQNKAVSEAKYATAVSELMQQVSVDLSETQASSIADKLKALITGEAVNIAGKEVESRALAAFLSPATSNANELVALLGAANLGDAVEPAQQLSATTQKRLNQKLRLSKYMQVAAGIIAALIYALLVIPNILRLSEEEETKAEVVKESKGIMSTVSEGLFLLDLDNQIGIEQSASLKQMFKSERDLEGDFFDFISHYVSPHTVQTAREYLGLLYSDRVKEKLVKDLNPLNEVEINLVRRDGSYESRYLDFQFSRVSEDDKLSHLLVSVTDETKRVLLERELAETKEEQEAQIDLLLSILHVDKKQLTTFFDTAEHDLQDVNNTLEARGHRDSEIRSKIVSISRTIHKLKGDAAGLGLHKFEFAAHALEEELIKAKDEHETLTGKELLPALTKLKDLFSELQKMQNIVGKLGENFSADMLESSADNAEAGQSIAVQGLVSKDSGIAGVLQELASTVAARNGKRAHLSVFGLNDDTLPESIDDTLKESLSSIAVQLVRNSIVHGSLEPQERLAAGKSDFINISASLTETDDDRVFVVRDDGEGFNNKKIMERAVSMGLLNEAQQAKFDEASAFRLLFHPGFSNLEEANLDGGRGMGLDVVHQMIKDRGGAIGVQHRAGRYCQFKVTIPKQANS